MEDQQKNEQNQGGDAVKVDKRYQFNMSRLVALFKGERNLKVKKSLPATDAMLVVDELIADKVKERKEQFKIQAAALLDKHVEFVKFEKEAKAKFDQEVLKKKKEFNQEAEKVLQLVDGIDKLREDYAASLKSVLSTPSEEEKDEEEEEQEEQDNSSDNASKD